MANWTDINRGRAERAEADAVAARAELVELKCLLAFVAPPALKKAREEYDQWLKRKIEAIKKKGP